MTTRFAYLPAIAGTPAVPEVPAVEAAITLQVSVAEAAVLRALLGGKTGMPDDGPDTYKLFTQLNEFMAKVPNAPYFRAFDQRGLPTVTKIKKA